MVPSNLNIMIALITFFLFIFYVVMKYYRNFIIRPKFTIIDNIYNSFYDIYFKDVTSSRQYLDLDKIYSTMSAKFMESSISDDDVKKYVDYLDEGSRQYWFFPVISVLASFLGISNMGSLINLVSEINIGSLINSVSEINMGSLINSVSEINISNLVLDSRIILKVIALIFIMFIIVFSSKIMSGSNLYRNTRNSWKKSLLQDYIDFQKSGEVFDFDKLQQARVILDFLSCFTLNREKKKIKFKKDESIKVLIDNNNEYDKLFEFSEKKLTIEHDEKKYLVEIQLMDDCRNIRVTPAISDNVDSNMSEDDEFRKLCEIKNYRVETMSQRSYGFPIIGWFYKKADYYERNGKKAQKLFFDFLFFMFFLFMYLLIAVVIYFGGIFVPIFFAVYIFADFLTTKIFRI